MWTLSALVTYSRRGVMYKLVVFIPDASKEDVKNALFGAGAGSLGAYRQCSWECLGIGQFMPNESANPYVGRSGVVERVSEWRVEMLVSDSTVDAVKKALYLAHPYEEPAFDLFVVEEPSPRS